MSEIFTYIIISIASYIGVEAFRRWSLRRNLFDVPNERSSHTIPTPRGGGLVIVIISLAVYSIYTLIEGEAFEWAYLLGALLIAGISWLDDLYSVSFIWRFCIHVAAALLVIFSLGIFREIHIPLFQINSGNEFGNFIYTLLWIVWLTNAYNFMDGIDGIAGTQAITAGIGWLIIGKLIGAESTAFFGGVIAFAALGFTIQNWQPAKIFMGDVGSAFLGYTFAVLPLIAGRELKYTSKNYTLLPMLAISLIWLFVFDTVYTFFRRLLKKEKVWQAHRGHIYQKLVTEGFRHQSVSIIYGLISILTISILIFRLLNQNENNSECILLTLLCIQSLGLLIGVYLFKREKNKTGFVECKNTGNEQTER